MTNENLSIANQIAQRARPLLLAFDIDGTLAPYHLEPQSARVPEATVQALDALTRTDGVVVALITGRAFPSMNDVITLPQAWRSAEHGAVIVAPGATYEPASMNAAESAKMQRFDAFVVKQLVPQGADFERKPRARAVHTRQVSQTNPGQGDDILKRAKTFAQEVGLHTRDGNFIVEAELDQADKGTALKEIAEKTRAETIYFAGDDLTDLPAIAHAHEHSQLGVFVHSEKRPQRPDQVSIALPNIEAHFELIEALAQCLGT